MKQEYWKAGCFLLDLSRFAERLSYRREGRYLGSKELIGFSL